MKKKYNQSMKPCNQLRTQSKEPEFKIESSKHKRVQNDVNSKFTKIICKSLNKFNWNSFILFQLVRKKSKMKPRKNNCVLTENGFVMKM